MVVGAAGRERAQPVGRQQMPPAGFNDAKPDRIDDERTMRQADGKDLVRTDAVVVAIRSVDHVVQALSVGPHEPCEAGPCDGGLGRERVRLAQHRGEFRHDAQRIVPQRVDLHRLADARRHHPIAHLGVHPGELHAGLAGPQQAIRRIHSDAVARAAPMPGDHVGKHRKRHAQSQRYRRSARHRHAKPRRTTARRRRCCSQAYRRHRGTRWATSPG